MKIIENTFEKYKTTYNLIKRNGNVALFSRIGKDFPLSYEVVIIQSHNGIEIGGVYQPPKEYLPGDNQWGTKGFSYVSLELAEKRFDNLVQEEKIRLTSKKSELK